MTMNERTIIKITYGKYIETRKGIKVRILKSAKHAEWAEIDYDKPDNKGFQGSHFEIKDALDFKVGDLTMSDEEENFGQESHLTAHYIYQIVIETHPKLIYRVLIHDAWSLSGSIEQYEFKTQKELLKALAEWIKRDVPKEV